MPSVMKEAFLLAAMCFATALLNVVEVHLVDISAPPPSQPARRLHPPANQRPARLGPAFKYGAFDVAAAALSTALLVIGHHRKSPEWFLPWLCVCLKGFVTCEGPYMFRLGCAAYERGEFMPALFLFTRTLLFVEELCLWAEILVICWVALSCRPPVPLTVLPRVTLPKETATVDRGTNSNDLVHELKLEQKL